jgi:hypothetical protein
LEKIVHVSDDKGNVKKREKMSDVLHGQHFVQQRLLRLPVRLIIFHLRAPHSHFFGDTE